MALCQNVSANPTRTGNDQGLPARFLHTKRKSGMQIIPLLLIEDTDLCPPESGERDQRFDGATLVLTETTKECVVVKPTVNEMSRLD